MKPRRTPDSNVVFRLPGGSEDNDLWVEGTLDEGGEKVLCTVWELSAQERQAVSEGANVELVIWGTGVPPMAMHITTTPLGKDGTDSRHITVEGKSVDG